MVTCQPADSRYLREVTDRGQPVARLVPVRRNSGLEELAQSGRLTPARGDMLELGPPLTAVAGKPLPSETLAELRSDER
jgi:hypothetical protein